MPFRLPRRSSDWPAFDVVELGGRERLFATSFGMVVASDGPPTLGLATSVCGNLSYNFDYTLGRLSAPKLATYSSKNDFHARVNGAHMWLPHVVAVSTARFSEP